MNKTFIGTSGWNYKHWRNGVFYPKGLAQNHWLDYYVKYFNTVELNVTFYRLVPKTTFTKWRKETPKDFCFVAKGSRFITHIKRLKDPKEPLNVFYRNVMGLKEKLACVLWQFAPNFHKDLGRLEDFLKLLQKRGGRQAFEFRHESWFSKETYDLLKKFKACLCIASSVKLSSVKELTSDFIYLRFHGINYGGNYSDVDLKSWTAFAKKSRPRDIFAYFNNDAQGFAVYNGLTFKKFLEQKR